MGQNILVILSITSHNDFRLGIKPEMPSVLEQMKLVFRKSFLMCKQIPQPERINLFREQTAAAGRGIIAYAELFGQRHLGFAGTACDIEEPCPVHQPFLLRDGFRKVLDAQGPDNTALVSGMFFHIPERRQGLGP